MLLLARPRVAFQPAAAGGQPSCASGRRLAPRAAHGTCSGWFSPFGHSLCQWVCSLSDPPESTFLCALRSTPITEFRRYYGHSDSGVAGASRPLPMRLRLLGSTQVSLLHAHHRCAHSVANHPTLPGHRFATLPLSVTGFRCCQQSGLRLCTAGSSQASGRIAFVIRRTERSPPVASHPVSRRRSYLWLQAGERLLGEDLHLSDGVRLQAHSTPPAWRPSCASWGLSLNNFERVLECCLHHDKQTKRPAYFHVAPYG